MPYGSFTPLPIPQIDAAAMEANMHALRSRIQDWSDGEQEHDEERARILQALLRNREHLISLINSGRFI